MKSRKDDEAVVLILDPRGLLSNDNSSSIKRHKTYAEELFKKDRLKLVAISSSKYSTYTNFESNNFCIYYVSKPTFNFIVFAIKAALLVSKKSFKVKLIIVGDPWESYWSAYFFRRITRCKAVIQIQLHGDFGNPSWRRMSIKSRIRHFFLRFSITPNNYFRTVSLPQLNYFVKNFKADPLKSVIVPVPISSFSPFRSYKFGNPRTIGFIGRIQQDRGLNEFIDLIAKLSVGSKELELFITGSGIETEKFLSKLEIFIPKSKIHYYGQLSEKELEKIWIKIGVLVSTAPTESYGRVMREALVAGVPVWATPSSGVFDLSSKAGNKIVNILDLSKSSEDLCEQLEQLFHCKVPLGFRNKFIKENSTYSTLLIESWIDLMNKQHRF